MQMATSATMVTTGDLDADGKGGILIGIWPSQGGVWVKYSKAGILGPAVLDRRLDRHGEDARIRKPGAWDRRRSGAADGRVELWSAENIGI